MSPNVPKTTFIKIGYLQSTVMERKVDGSGETNLTVGRFRLFGPENRPYNLDRNPRYDSRAFSAYFQVLNVGACLVSVERKIPNRKNTSHPRSRRARFIDLSRAALGLLILLAVKLTKLGCLDG